MIRAGRGAGREGLLGKPASCAAAAGSIRHNLAFISERGPVGDKTEEEKRVWSVSTPG